MITVYVEHYLNTDGKYFFSGWVEKVKSAIQTREGFISIENALKSDEEHKDWCASVLLEFENEALLNAWVATSEHEALVDNLDPYRTRPWKVRWESSGQPTKWFNGPAI